MASDVRPPPAPPTAPPTPTRPRALDDATRGVVATLGLAPHPEGGFFRETHRGALELDGLPHGGPRAAHTAIYFLLPEDTFSALHVVRARDEVWHHYDGAPLELVLVHDDGRVERRVLGRDLAGGERPQAVVPAGVWQAARPLGGPHTLAGCTVAPGFDFRDFAMPERAELAARFAGHAEALAVVRAFTRA